MFTHLAGFSLLFFLFYLVIFAFLIWMAYRFVTAHESIANSLKKIEQSYSDPDSADHF